MGAPCPSIFILFISSPIAVYHLGRWEASYRCSLSPAWPALYLTLASESDELSHPLTCATECTWFGIFHCSCSNRLGGWGSGSIATSPSHDPLLTLWNDSLASPLTMDLPDWLLSSSQSLFLGICLPLKHYLRLITCFPGRSCTHVDHTGNLTQKPLLIPLSK